MKRQIKGLISLFLALAMCLSLLSSNVWAEEDTEQVEQSNVTECEDIEENALPPQDSAEASVDLDSLQEGDTSSNSATTQQASNKETNSTDDDNSDEADESCSSARLKSQADKPLKMSKNSVTLKAGEQVTVYRNTYDEEIESVRSSNVSIAKAEVNYYGGSCQITGLTPGSTTVIVTGDKGTEVSISVQVNSFLKEDSVTVNAGAEKTIGILGVYSYQCTASSSNTGVAVATLDYNGVHIKGINNGYATVYVNGPNDSACTLSVNVVEAPKTQVTVEAGCKLSVSADFLTNSTSSGYRTYSAVSTDNSIATASFTYNDSLERYDPLVKGISPGNAIIKIKDNSGLVGTLEVTVTIPPLKLNKNEITIDDVDDYVISASGCKIDTAESSNPEIVDVDVQIVDYDNDDYYYDDDYDDYDDDDDDGDSHPVQVVLVPHKPGTATITVYSVYGNSNFAPQTLAKMCNRSPRIAP